MTLHQEMKLTLATQNNTNGFCKHNEVSVLILQMRTQNQEIILCDCCQFFFCQSQSSIDVFSLSLETAFQDI